MVIYYYKAGLIVNSLPSDTIFVFGSNLLGIHGKGSALTARRCFGAQLRIGLGLCGQSYALPTKRTPYESLSFEEIASNVKDFLDFARDRPDLNFFVSKVATMNAGYCDSEIAPLFNGLPDNCAISQDWVNFIDHTEAIEISI